MKKKLNRVKRVLCLCLVLLLLLSLVACDKQAEAQDSTSPAASVEPTIAPTPTPEPTPPIPYTDVPENSFYYDAVVWAYENGITSDDSLFDPLSTCSRAQAMLLAEKYLINCIIAVDKSASNRLISFCFSPILSSLDSLFLSIRFTFFLIFQIILLNFSTLQGIQGGNLKIFFPVIVTISNQEKLC